MSELFPPGVTDIRDMPHTLFDAIRRALTFLSFEDLEKEERPPKSIWLDDEKLSAHFEWVEERRKERFSGKPDEEIEDPVENDAARSLLIG